MSTSTESMLLSLLSMPSFTTYCNTGAVSKKRIMELSLLRTFAAGSESTMVWNFRSRERKFQELSLPRQVTFGRDIRSWICIGLCIRGCVRVLGLMALYIRRRPNNRHFQHTTLVSLTVIFYTRALQRLLLTSPYYCLDYFSIRHSQTFHYFISTAMFNVVPRVAGGRCA